MCQSYQLSSTQCEAVPAGPLKVIKGYVQGANPKCQHIHKCLFILFFWHDTSLAIYLPVQCWLSLLIYTYLQVYKTYTFSDLSFKNMCTHACTHLFWKPKNAMKGKTFRLKCWKCRGINIFYQWSLSYWKCIFCTLVKTLIFLVGP